MVRSGWETPPARVVDPGVGSGRFLVTAGRQMPRAVLVGVELDPAVAVLARGHLAGAGLASRATVQCLDYRRLKLPPIDGPTLFVGNPPYVRHHDIAPEWKAWLGSTASQLGLKASKLAGLHVHFFVATAQLARAGDRGFFVTASEWLDVNYGRLVRDLLVGPLGLVRLHLVAPEALPFDDAMTTAVVVAFVVGSEASTVGFDIVEEIDKVGDLAVRRGVSRDALAQSPRWTPLSPRSGSARLA